MKQPILLTSLIFSALALNAQNLTNIQQVNYTNTQQLSNVSLNNDINQFASNNVDIQVQTNRGSRGNSALQSFSNTGNNPNKVQANINQPQVKTNNKPKVQTNVNNLTIEDNNNVDRGNRGNNFDINDNVLNENVNRGRGGNLIVNDNNINNDIQSNPVVNDTKKMVASKPVIQDYPGLSFKPSGLSGRDYSNGGKLKKGQKNFYTPSKSKHKTIHKKKPTFKKVKHHTSKCAKW